ncbi:MAG: hypothetical protein V3V16_03710 [Melioribacteraceae bacterium]
MQSKIFILFLLVYANYFAQNEINLSLKSEIGFTQISIGEVMESNFHLLPIQNLSLVVDVNLYNNIFFQFRPGFIISKNNYEGFELGGYIGYKILNTKLHSQVGINYHFNSSVDGNSGGSGQTIALVGFGVGYQISKTFSIDISYHHPIKKKYGSFGYPDFHQRHNIERIIELGFGIRIN